MAHGGRGGGKAAAHLGQILAGLRMKIVEPAVLLDISAENGHACFEKSELIVAVRQLWSKAGLDKNVKKELPICTAI